MKATLFTDDDGEGGDNIDATPISLGLRVFSKCVKICVEFGLLDHNLTSV